MKKEMLINVLQPEECRIAILEDGILEELYVERTSHESYTGNIYKGKVVNLEPAIQAAFVDFSVGRNGFLHVSDVEPQYYRGKGGDEGEAAPAREPRRDRERASGGDRGRRPRPPASAEDRDPLPPPPSYPDDRTSRPERPDRSEKGHRDRTERRFGEGLADQEDWRPSPPPPRAAEPPPVRQPEPERFEREEPQARRRSEVAPPASRPPEPPARAPRLPDAYEPVRSATPVDEPRARVSRPPADPFEIDLPPSRTNRQRAPMPPPRPTEPVSEVREVRTRAVPASRSIEGEDAPRTRAVPASRSIEGEDAPRTRTAAPAPIRDREPVSEPADVQEREPRRGRGGRPARTPRPEAEARFQPEPETVDPILHDEVAHEPAHTDRPEAPRRRGGRDAIRGRGGDREASAPRELAAPREPSVPREPVAPRAPVAPREPERFRPVAEERVAEPTRERSRPIEAPRPIAAERPPVVERPSAPERRRAVEPERPAPGSTRDREPNRPTDRAGEEGYVPRRMRAGDSLFDPEPSPASWSDVDDDRGDDLDAAGDSEHEPESEADRAAGTRRRRRRRRRREGDRPTRDVAKAPADDLDLDLDLDESVPPLTDEGPHADDFDFGDEARHDEDDDEDDFDDDEASATRGAPNPDDEIDPELEEEIRKEIEEIAELEREMGLRGPVEARPRRGDDSEADGGRGGKSPRGRGTVKPPLQDIFRRGDEVLVQVIKESIGTKGPTLSTYISIPGRYLVLMPGLNRVGVSRKIADEGQRRKLREIMTDLNPPKGLGFIVRTAGLDRSKRDLARDLAYLLRLWKVILRRIKVAKGPTPIYQESDMITRTIRDIFTAEIDTIWIDEPAAFERAQEFLRVVMPRFVNRLKLYDEKVPLFHKYGIEDEIAKIQRRRVDLPEGGSIVIDQTEALVAIDVNSGNFRFENDPERTAYEMNLRAAKEIARQLRLRDLGGVIVNDFIDMRDEKNRRGVEKAIRDAIKRDRARTKVLRMSQFGLIEMTRQRIRPSLKRSVYEDCTHCAGMGQVKTVESMSIDVMRLLALASNRADVRRVNIGVCLAVANYLNNRKRSDLTRFEVEANMTIHIRHEDEAPPEHLQIDCFDANNNEIRLIPQPAAPPRRGR